MCSSMNSILVLRPSELKTQKSKVIPCSFVDLYKSAILKVFSVIYLFTIGFSTLRVFICFVELHSTLAYFLDFLLCLGSF